MEVHLSKIGCILCRSKYDPLSDFKNIEETNVPTSRRSVKDVLIHLGKGIKGGITLLNPSYVCAACYDKLVECNKIIIQLIAHQKQISPFLEPSMVTPENTIVKEETVKNELLSDDSLNNYDYESIHNEDLSQDLKIMPDTFADKSTICTQCGKELSSIPAMRRHMELHNNQFLCKICGVSRRDEEYLELHMNVHEGKSEYECRYCPKRYARKANVIRHMHLHWDKKKFQCETCGLRFSQSHILYNHKLTHDSDEAPLACDKCDQTFKSRKTLNHHLGTHRKDRPMHMCEVCGKKFTEKYTLKLHLKTHKNSAENGSESLKNDATVKKHIKKEFNCIICSDFFELKDILDAHMYNDHDVINESSL